MKIHTEGLLFPYYEYEYFCCVTNMNISPPAAHRFYNLRGNCENLIEIVKNQVYGGTILTDNFWANSILFAISVLQYNVLVWMRWLTDKSSWKCNQGGYGILGVQTRANKGPKMLTVRI